MRYALPAAMALALAGLASCYSLSKEQCAAANWQMIGEADGAAGYEPLGRISDHTKACARIKVVPDQTLWNQGYQAGVLRYCTPLNGLARGEAGDTYHNVCPPNLAPDFLRGYTLGQRAHEVRARMETLDNEMSSNEYRIDELRSELKVTRDQGRRREILDEIDQLSRDIRWARLSADEAELSLIPIQREIDRFRRDPYGRAPVPGY